MKSVGIITEYNPFHNGHLYHIETSKQITGADTVVCVMSGNYVQRGEPAIIDKYSRATMALNNGINLLVELPTFYACSSAEYFAFGGIMTLASLGVESVCFGSECGDIRVLSYISSILINEPEELSHLIKRHLTNGYSYPKARMLALSDYIENNTTALEESSIEFSSDYINEVLSHPNNILGIEYIKVILKYKLDIKPYTIKRIGSNYNDNTMTNEMPSASAIRTVFETIASHESIASNDSINHSMPDTVYLSLLSATGVHFPVVLDDFSLILNAKLIDIIHHDCTKLTQYLDVTPDFANRICNVFSGYETFTELIVKLKNKQMTYTRISRSLMHILLEIKSEHIKKYINHDTQSVPYIRLLGFDTLGQVLLSSVKGTCDIPIITKPANHKELLSEDIYAANIYNMIVYTKFKTKLSNENKHSPIR